MTKPLSRASILQLLSAAAVLAVVPATLAQTAAPNPAPAQQGDRGSAYYHYGLAHMYEDMAVSAGRPDFATQAIEEYKLAMDADPTSNTLKDGLAELYFKLGRIREAVTSAQEQVKEIQMMWLPMSCWARYTCDRWETCRASSQDRCSSWQSQSTRSWPS